LGIIIHGGDVRGSDKSSSSHGAGGGGFAGGSKIKFLSSSLSGGRDKRALPPSTALGWMSQNSNEWLGMEWHASMVLGLMVERKVK
jgi:hypothetical protein